MESIAKLDTINVGIVGHIDHGKTTLLQKLSGKWADTHSEELKRGITIKLGYADAIVKNDKGKLTVDKNSKGEPKRYITFVDAPGHEMLMATMLSGAAIMDAAILVVAANEGIKPQTQEHLVALKAKKIKNIIIVQNKIDLVSKEKAMANYKDIKKFVKGTIAENSPIIPVSAIQGVNLDKVLEELCNVEISKPDKSKKPIFLVARSFDINKPGTKIETLHGGVLGGALKSGALKIGDTIDLTKADSLSGGIASTEGSLPEITENITMKYTLFKEVFGTGKHESVQGIKPNEILMLSLNTSITVGQVTKTKENAIDLSLKIPVVPLKGE